MPPSQSSSLSSSSSSTSPLIQRYLGDLAVQNPNTAKVVGYYLEDFVQYVKDAYYHHYPQDASSAAIGGGGGRGRVDQVIKDVKSGKVDVFDLLRGYVHYLDARKLKPGKISPATLIQKVKVVKRLLEYNDIDISSSKFKMRVKMPRSVKRQKSPLTKNDIRELLNACQDIRLKTFLMWLASSGCRATESMALRLGDIDFSQSPAAVTIRGENTKTRQERRTYLTAEMEKQLREWIAHKYRPRTNVIFNRKSQRYDHVKINPTQRQSDYVFMPYHQDESLHNNPRTLEYGYINMERAFLQLLARLGYDKGANGKHGEITFHSCRRYVYTTVDNLGLNQFAEYYIGHSNSPYWSKPEEEKVETFRKIEPYITFLDVASLEAKGADMHTKLEQSEEQVRAMREQLSTLFQIMAIEDTAERQRRLSEAAKEWIGKGLYRATR
jgi:integrase